MHKQQIVFESAMVISDFVILGNKSQMAWICRLMASSKKSQSTKPYMDWYPPSLTIEP